MAEEKVDGETTENTEPEETPEEPKEPEEVPEEEPKEPEEPKEEPEVDASKELEAKNRQLFERVKKAEEAEKALKKENARLKKDKSPSENLDVDSILEVQTATKGLNSEEVEELRLRAKAKDISLSEARKDENFVLLLKAKREKVAKAKALNPSTNQPESKKSKTLEERLKTAKFADKEKILQEAGLNPMVIGNDIDKEYEF